jgi:hypothetical protein
MAMGKERGGGWCAGADGEEGGVRTAETFLGEGQVKEDCAGAAQACTCMPASLQAQDNLTRC